MPEKHKMRISEILQETPSIMAFRFVPASGKLFEYAAGQFAILNIPDFADKGNVHRRSYSIASSPMNREYIELCIAISDTGTTGPILKAAKAGDVFEMEGPFGKFLFDTEAKSHNFLVGSGSGIAPLIGMLRTIVVKKLASKTEKTTLIYGFRRDEDFAYGKELLSYKSPCIDILPVASTPSPDWKFSSGHVQDVIRALPTESFKGSSWYLCGPPDMVRDVQSLLLEKGVPQEKIKKEIYG